MMTTPQVMDESKTVTRRMGWRNLKPGTRLQLVKKGMGLKKGETVQRLKQVEVLSVTRERLDAIGPDDVGREGFPDMSPREFVDMYCVHHRGCLPSTQITRIEWTYFRKNDDLVTPEWVWQPLGPFDLDPCAGRDTRIAEWNHRTSEGANGLDLDWGFLDFVWCNPPFSQKEKWIEKMIDHGNGILLLPERGSAPWFLPAAMAAGHYFVMGKKINFEGGASSNNIGSVLFTFGELARKRVAGSGLPGHMVSTSWGRERAVN